MRLRGFLIEYYRLTIVNSYIPYNKCITFTTVRNFLLDVPLHTQE